MPSTKKIITSLLNTALMVFACYLIGYEYIFIVATIGFIFIFFKIPLKLVTSPVTTLFFYLLSDNAFKHTDSYLFLAEKKLNLGFTLNTLNLVLDKIFGIFFAIVFSFILVKILSKMKLNEIWRNGLLLMTIVFSLPIIHLGSIIPLLSKNFSYIFFSVFCIYVVRATQLPESKLETFFIFLKETTPPFFDNGYFVRHSSKEKTTFPQISSTAITRKLTYFLAIFIFGTVVSKYLFASDFWMIEVSGKSLLPNLNLYSLQFHISHQTPKQLLALCIFFKGLLFITNILSISLISEAAYLIFGYDINAQFSWKFQSKGFAEFYTQTIPMHADYLKNAYIFPISRYLSKYTNSKPIIYAGIIFSVLFGSSLLNVMKFLMLSNSSDFIFPLINTIKSEIACYTLIALVIFLFRANRRLPQFAIILQNLFFVFVLGVVLLLRLQSGEYGLNEKILFFRYLLGV